jgi:hypothetical protein
VAALGFESTRDRAQREAPVATRHFADLAVAPDVARPELLHDYLTRVRRRVTMARTDNDNRADQLNPNNDAYWESRGYDDRPDDWEDRVGPDKEDE